MSFAGDVGELGTDFFLSSSACFREENWEDRRLVSEATLSDRRLDCGLESDVAKEVKSVDTRTGSLNFREGDVPLLGEVGEEELFEVKDNELRWLEALRGVLSIYAGKDTM